MDLAHFVGRFKMPCRSKARDVNGLRFFKASPVCRFSACFFQKSHRDLNTFWLNNYTQSSKGTEGNLSCQEGADAVAVFAIQDTHTLMDLSSPRASPETRLSRRKLITVLRRRHGKKQRRRRRGKGGILKSLKWMLGNNGRTEEGKEKRQFRLPS